MISRSFLRPALSVVFWGVLIYFALAFLAPQWRSLDLSARLSTLPLPRLLAAGTVIVVHYAYMFGLWAAILHQLGARATRTGLARAYILSLVPKYVPGKIVSYGFRAKLAGEAGVPGPTITASLFAEIGFALASAAFVAAVGLLVQHEDPLRDATRWLVTVFVVGALVALVLTATPRIGSRLSEWTGLRHFRSRPRLMAGFLLLYVGNWIISAVAHWFLLTAFTPFPVGALPGLALALAVSWGVGVLSVIAPAGLGVREGVLYVFALGWMGAADALLFVTLSRLLAFGVEVLLTLLWGLGSVRIRGA